MNWDDDQRVTLARFRELYREGFRQITQIEQFGSRSSITVEHPGDGRRESVPGNAADCRQFAAAGLVNVKADDRSYLSGTLTPKVLAWDAPPPIPAPPFIISGDGNAVNYQHGQQNVMANVRATGGTVGDVGRLRDELAALLEKSSDPIAAEVLATVDEASDAAARGTATPRMIGATFKTAIENGAKLATISTCVVTLVKAIAAAYGIHVP